MEEDVEVPREAAAALCALSLNEENKLDMARAGVMADIVALAQVEDHWTVRQACGCLANLSENKDAHPFVLGDWGVGYLCELATHRDVALVREVARCLTNLAGNYACHARLMAPPLPGQRSLPEALSVVLRAQDSVATRFACLGVVNLSAVPDNQPPFLALGVCEALVELACGEPREWIDLDGNGTHATPPPPLFLRALSSGCSQLGQRLVFVTRHESEDARAAKHLPHRPLHVNQVEWQRD